MKTSQALLMLAAGVTAAVAFADPAKAFTLTLGGASLAGQGLVSSQSGVTNIDFSSGAPTSGLASYSAASGSPTVVSGSLFNQYAAPTGLSATNNYLTIAPIGSGVVGATGAVTISLSGVADYFGFYAGSIDSFNKISFFNGNSLVKAYTGDDFLSSRGGADGATSDYVNFFADNDGEYFDTIVIDSDGISFETDNHAFRLAAVAIPEPTTMTGLVLAALAGAAYKRRQQRDGFGNAG